MKVKGLLIAVLLTATNFAWAAGGGLSIDNVEQHMKANNMTKTNNGRPEIAVKSSTERFDFVTSIRNQYFADNYIEDDPYADFGT